MNNNYLKFNWTPVINWESGGRVYYEKHLNRFTYPGGASGPTIMIGIDCAYYTETELRKIFNFLPRSDINLIVGCIGKTREAAKNYLPKLKHIRISWEKAEETFYNLTLPKFYKLTNNLWKGTNSLCPNAQVALTSLVFNRGTSLRGSSRVEMAEISKLVPQKNYKNIANEIVKMKRLWEGKNLNGLLRRRDEEAKLILSCV
jgi:GH24 family phage-related lysozyme (muramidase)